MTWDSDSGPSSNLVEQSHSFLCTELAQGQQREEKQGTHGVPDYTQLGYTKGLQGEAYQWASRRHPVCRTQQLRGIFSRHSIHFLAP
jgi:hypothetical protein